MRFLLFIPLLFFVPSTRGGVPQMDQSNWVSLKNGGEVGRYFRKKDIIYVHVNGMVQQALKNADVTSFKVNKIHSDYARDKNNIWFVSEIKKVDTATWVILDSSYNKDKRNVYYGNRTLNKANPKTFKVIRSQSPGWGADDRAVYSEWFELEASDPKTFEFIQGPFSKDKGNVYYNQNRLESADPKTFMIIAGNVARDKNYIYAFGKRMPAYIDKPSVRVPGDGYIYDKNGRYHLYQGEWIKTELK